MFRLYRNGWILLFFIFATCQCRIIKLECQSSGDVTWYYGNRELKNDPVVGLRIIKVPEKSVLITKLKSNVESNVFTCVDRTSGKVLFKHDNSKGILFCTFYHRLLSVCLSFNLPVSLSVNRSVCMSICLPIYLRIVFMLFIS